MKKPKDIQSRNDDGRRHGYWEEYWYENGKLFDKGH